MKPVDLNTKTKIQWCPGCGDFGIVAAIKNALAKLDLPQKDTVIVSGIGCSGKLPHYIKTYGFEGLHGRALPVATAVKLVNHKLTVVAVGGDGDGYGIGTGHFIHTLRRNVDMTYVVHNNGVYGLTTGQTSPTAGKGYKSNSTPHGVIELPFNPIEIALAAGATYVARGYTDEIQHLINLIVGGIQHKGIAFIDVLQPCVTYNKVYTREWYKSHIYKLDDVKHDPSNFELAVKRGQEWNEKVPIGLFYKADRKTYEDELPQLAAAPLVAHDISQIDITKAQNEFI